MVLAAGGRCFAEARERGVLTTNGPGATGEVGRIAAEIGAETRDTDSLQHHPNGGAWPPPLPGYSIPETTRAYGALLVNGEGERFIDELAPRDTVADAIVRECAGGPRPDHAGRTPGRAAGHPADRAETTLLRCCRTCCGATARRGSTRWPSRSSPIPCLALPEQAGSYIGTDGQNTPPEQGPVRSRRDHPGGEGAEPPEMWSNSLARLRAVFGRRVEPGRAVAPQHVRQHLSRGLRLDRPGVQPRGRASVRRGQAAALLALADDRISHSPHQFMMKRSPSPFPSSTP